MTKIVVLGSTGSIGKSLLKIISKDKRSFDVKLLTANKNYRQLLKQAKLFNVKNVILTDKRTYQLKKNNFKKNKINIFNNYSDLNNILKGKVDYVMNSVVGLNGLEPTLNIIKYTRHIAIANKESIICAWNLIDKQLKKFKTNFIPVDSEHFSVWYALSKKLRSESIKKIYLTASGGPLLNLSTREIKKIKINQVLKHPTWNMGKKISIDSATLMNKVFEVIEAKKLFNLEYNQIDILIHPDSYIHAIVKFKDNMISLIAHNTTMDIPIFNTLNFINKKFQKKNVHEIDLKKLNNLNFKTVDKIKFQVVKILSKLPNNNSLFETALVAANDQLVEMYLKKKIKFNQIQSNLFKIINLKEVKLLKQKIPNNINEIFKINSYVRSEVITKYNQKIK
jgi:1-deoxy-D-xylulose-5-phosphate reductoisomerase